MMRGKETNSLIYKVRDAHDPTPRDFERVLAGLPAKIAKPPRVQLVDASLPEVAITDVEEDPKRDARAQMRLAVTLVAIAVGLAAVVAALAFHLHGLAR